MNIQFTNKIKNTFLFILKSIILIFLFKKALYPTTALSVAIPIVITFLLPEGSNAFSTYLMLTVFIIIVLHIIAFCFIFKILGIVKFLDKLPFIAVCFIIALFEIIIHNYCTGLDSSILQFEITPEFFVKGVVKLTYTFTFTKVYISYKIAQFLKRKFDRLQKS